MLDTLIIFGAKYLWLVALLGMIIYFLFQSRDRKEKIAPFSLIVLLISYVIARGIGLFYYNPQPFVVGKFTPLIAHVPDNGFPSDHTLLVAALASVIFFYNRFLGAILFLLAVAVGVSRVFAGVHHTIDIAGSIVIAIAVAVIVRRTLRG